MLKNQTAQTETRYDSVCTESSPMSYDCDKTDGPIQEFSLKNDYCDHWL